MASLIQMKRIYELLGQGYITVDNPEYKNLDPMDIPIGGPIMIQSPYGMLYKVYANGTVMSYD